MAFFQKRKLLRLFYLCVAHKGWSWEDRKLHPCVFVAFSGRVFLLTRIKKCVHILNIRRSKYERLLNGRGVVAMVSIAEILPNKIT